MPYTDAASGFLPFSGRTPQARHNSYRAALSQQATRGTKKLRMLAYIREHQLVTYHGLMDGLRSADGQPMPAGSVCSLLNALMSEGLIAQVDTAMGPYGKDVSVYGPVDAGRMS